MASVADLLQAAETKKSPLIRLLEGSAQGFGQAQNTALERTKTLIALEQARREAEEQAELQKQIQAQIDTQAENSIVQAHKGVGGRPPSVLRSQKFQTEILQDEKGRYSRRWKTVEPKEPDSFEAILAAKYRNGEISLDEFAERMRSKSATSFMKPPTGFRPAGDGNLEAIPGGPADIKQQQREEKEAGLRDATVRQADLMLEKVDQTLKNVSGFTAGLGSRLSAIPGTPARNLEKDIDTLKANLGFEALQEMRRNSPTGGALGQVAVQELEMLQSTVSSLDPTQSPAQLKRNLNEVKKHFENWKNAVVKSQSGDSGGAKAPSVKNAGDRFNELMESGKSEDEAYGILVEEGY